MMLKNTNHGFYTALRNNDVAEVLRWLQNPNLRLTKFIGPIFEAAAASQHAEGGVAVYDHIVDKQYHLSKQEIEGIFASAHQANNGALFYALFEDLRLHIDSTAIGKYFESALKKGNGEIVCATANHVYSSIFTDRMVKALRAEQSVGAVQAYMRMEVPNSDPYSTNRFSMLVWTLLRKQQYDMLATLVADDQHLSERLRRLFIAISDEEVPAVLNALVKKMDFDTLAHEIAVYNTSHRPFEQLSLWVADHSKKGLWNNLPSVSRSALKKKL